MQEGNGRGLKMTEKAVVVFLWLESLGIILLASWNYLMRSRLEEAFHPMGADLPPLTDILSSPYCVIAAILVGFVFLYLLKVLGKKNRKKTLLFISLCALIVLLLEALSIYLSYWKLTSML